MKKNDILLAALYFFVFYGIDNILRIVFSLIIDQFVFNAFSPTFYTHDLELIQDRFSQFEVIYVNLSSILRVFLSVLISSLLLNKFVKIIDYKKVVTFSTLFYFFTYSFYLNGINWVVVFDIRYIITLFLLIVVFSSSSYFIFKTKSK